MPDAQLDAILREAVSRRSSDIHIKVGVPPYMRINGSLTPYGDAPNTREEVDRIILAVLDGDPAGQLKVKREIDMAYTVAGVARFRCNIFRQRGMLEMVMRVVPYKIPSIDELGLPGTLKHLALETRGMVLVTGITGSGKSTTIASMVQHLNESLPVHIVTIEDPIEFVYRDVKASISQREVGIDTDSFHDALKYVLRQDPDVILLGEMRDRETAATALTAAETGHLVFSTLHTADAVQTIDRIIDMFPGDQQNQIRHAVSITMKATVSMRLIPKADGKGLAPAIEIMIVTPAIKALIAEGKLSEIRQLIAEGAGQYGMQTFDQSILKLHKAGTITKETALEEATSPAELELAMRGITTGTISAQSFLKSSDDGYYKAKAKEFYDRARRLFQQDLVEDALREVRRALVDYADYAEAKELLGKIEERMGKESAKAQVQPFIKKGLELVAQDKIEEALAVFNQGLAMDPHNEQLLTMKRAAEDKGTRTRNTKPLLDRAQVALAASNWAEARQALSELLELEPGSSEGYERLAELLAGQARQQAMQELESLSTQAEAASTEKKWFDAVAFWNLVRELQPDHPKAMARVGEAGGQIKGLGVPGLAAHAQQPWASSVIQMFERGLTAFLGGNTGGCLAEWKQIGAKFPQASELLTANLRKVEELHAAHVKYHLDLARSLATAGEHGRALAQLRHALGVDPASTEARAMWDAQSPAAGQALARHLADAEQWEKMDRLRAAVFSYERALEIDPGREAVKAKVTDGRARLAKLKDLHAAMDKR